VLVTWWVRSGSDTDPAQTAADGSVASTSATDDPGASADSQSPSAAASGSASAGSSAGTGSPTGSTPDSTSGATSAAGQSAGTASATTTTGGSGAVATAGAGSCGLPGGTVTVAVAPELAGTLTALRDTLRPNGCTLGVRSADPASFLAYSTGVDVWIPDSSIWLERAEAAGRAPAGSATSIATSPVVLALSPPAASRLDASRASIRAILASRGSATPIRVGLPDPQKSAAAIGAILSARAAVSGTADARAALTWAVRSSPPGMPSRGDQLLARLPADPGIAVPVSEQEVSTYNRSHPKAPAIAVYERTGGVALDYPLVAVRNDPAVTATATDLASALTGDNGRAALAKAGFRGADGRAGTGLDGVAGVDPAVTVTDPLPTLAEVDDAIRTAQLTNEPSRMLAVMDVSGSMQSQVPGAGGASRMDLAKEAAARGLALYPASSEIGLWVFSRKLDGDSDHRQLIPVGPLGADSDGTSGAQRLAAAVASIKAVPDGGTGLYDTVLDAVRTMRVAWDPAKVNAVLILSDGMNDDQGSIGLDDLLETLKAEQDPSRPVPVVSIAFGPDSDVGALAAISKATGGSAYQSRDPKQIGEIFLDAVGQRLCRPGC
jgi:hypothetical protein